MDEISKGLKRKKAAVSRLRAISGEEIEIRFTSDPFACDGLPPYLKSGESEVWSTKALDIEIRLFIPEYRRLPKRILVYLSSIYSEFTFNRFSYEEEKFIWTLSQNDEGSRTFSANTDDMIFLVHGANGKIYSRRQQVEFILVYDTEPFQEVLTDPMNGTTCFQVNLDLAQLWDEVNCCPG